MGTKRRYTFRAGLIGLLSLLALSLALPQPNVASSLAAICSDGFALWANSATRSDTLVIAGGQNTLSGPVRSNADLKLSGSNNQLSGPITYATGFEDGGDANTYPAPTQAAPAAAPLSYTIASYRPGGAAALAAAQVGRYTVVTGDLDVAEPTALNGIYYVTGNAKLAASDITGTFTIVAEGMIDVSGSNLDAGPYADGLLLFSNKNEPGAATIKLAGSNSDLRGVIYGVGGLVELSGSNNFYAGGIMGDTLTLSGSSLSVAYAPGYCPGGAGDPPLDPNGPFATGEVVVKLFNAADLPAVARAYALDPLPQDQFGTRPIYRLRILDGSSPQFKAAQLRPAGGVGGDGRVEYAEPNYLAQDPESRRGRGSWVLVEGASGYAEQWAPDLIRLPLAHTISRGAGVTVAVLDTGIDATHPAFAGRLVPGFDFVDFDGDPGEVLLAGAPNAGYGHGTHVAGLVALAAPEAKIMPVRVLDSEGVGNIWVLSEGLFFAAELGRDGVPLSGDEAQVVNLSLGTTRPTRLLQDLVTDLTCATREDDDDDDEGQEGGAAGRCGSTGGAVVLAAAGNGGDTIAQYPAAEAVAGSLAIGASTRLDTRADFSTYGPWVRLAAPGEAIISTVPGGAYGTWSGTSMATPLAAGVAALVRSTEPGLPAADVVARLVSTGRPIAGPIQRRLDAAAALGQPSGPEAGPTEIAWVYLPALVTR